MVLSAFRLQPEMMASHRSRHREGVDFFLKKDCWEIDYLVCDFHWQKLDQLEFV